MGKLKESLEHAQTTYAQVMPKLRPYAPTGVQRLGDDDVDECPNFLPKCTGWYQACFSLCSSASCLYIKNSLLIV